MLRSGTTRAVSSAASLSAVLLLAGCGQAPQRPAGGGPPPPSVTVAAPVKRMVTDQDEYVGRFVAIDSVEVRARVSGYLDRIEFADGQLVKQGDLLFVVDKRPFETALDQAKANLSQSRANLSFAEADLQRGTALVDQRTISVQTYDQRIQAKKVAEAAVQAQEAAVRQATLDLEFTELKAPVAGRIGDRRVSPGNLVTGGTAGNTTLLATIVSVDPMRFEFTFDEASYLRYQRMAKGDLRSREAGITIALKLLDEPDFPHQGRMDFVNNVIDTSSGTIRGRAVLTNADGVFTPGMFARVQVPGSPPYSALLVPDTAIGTEQARKYVLVVDSENTARIKYVTLGQLSGNLRVIKSGIDENDRIVVNGLMRARPNTKVNPQQEGAPPPASPQAKN
jgi:RND family efflux transporter MFP subunit